MLLVGDPASGHHRFHPTMVATSFAGTPTLLIQDFGGDGAFPVFGEFDGRDLIRLIVEFEEPEEE